MKIELTTVYVDDQEKALRFYTEVLGFVKKADVSQGPYRWLTVASPEEPDGTELQLERNDNASAKAYQQALFQQGHPPPARMQGYARTAGGGSQRALIVAPGPQGNYAAASRRKVAWPSRLVPR